MGDIGDVYDETRSGIVDLVLSLEEDRLSTRVPACPDWTIKELVAHLTGVASDWWRADWPRDFLNTWADPSATFTRDDWTAGHVSSRADASIKEVVDEWAEHAARVVAMLKGKEPLPDGAPMFADRVIVTDIAAHGQDIYGAVGIVRDRRSAAVKIGLSSYIGWLDFRLSGAGNPLRIDAGERQWVVGGDNPVATVRADRFELFRALSGRRSPDQIRALDWDGDAEPFVPAFYPYSPRSEPIVE